MDTAELLRELEVTCGGGDGEACNNLGVRYLLGKDVEKDVERAVDLFVRGCDADSATACYHKGLMAYHGKGMPSPDLLVAKEAFEKACLLDEPASCNNAGVLAQSGAAGLPPDHEAAESYFIKACNLDEASGCLNAARVAAVAAQDESNEGKEDAARNMVAYLKKGCDLGGATACFSLGSAYLHGRGMEKADPLRAAAAFGRGCGAGHADSCFLLGVSHFSGSGVPRDVAKGAKYYRIACERNSAQGCISFAQCLAAGEGVPANPAAAQHIYQRGLQLQAQKEASKATGGAVPPPS